MLTVHYQELSKKSLLKELGAPYNRVFSYVEVVGVIFIQTVCLLEGVLLFFEN